jgi:hypothetical protein
VWSSIVQGLVFNPDTAIVKKWLEEKADGNPLGVPITGELPDPDTGGVQMAFSSGYVIKWDASNGATVE